MRLWLLLCIHIAIFTVVNVPTYDHPGILFEQELMDHNSTLRLPTVQVLKPWKVNTLWVSYLMIKTLFDSEIALLIICRNEMSSLNTE